MRPELYFTGRGKPHRWTRRDRGLAEGLEFYEQHLTGHGVPDWLAFDPAQEWEPDEAEDGYAKVIEETDAEYRKDGKDRPAGLRIWAVPKGSAPLGRDADGEQDGADEPDKWDLPAGQ